MVTTRKVGSFTWYDLVGRSEEDERLLADLGLRRMDIDDLLGSAVHPKAQLTNGYLLTVVHGLDLDYAHEHEEFELETIELDAMIGPGWVLTHADHPLEVIRQTITVVEANPDAIESPCELLHLVLDALIDEYEPFLEDFIPRRIDAIEDELFAERVTTAGRREIYLRRRDVIRIQRVALPQAKAMHDLVDLAKDCPFACDEAPLFRDIAERLVRIASVSTGLRAELDSAFEHYLSAAANRQNEVMKVLTMVSAILLPMTVIAGIYGMNFLFMPELAKRWGYPFALGLMAASGLFGYLYFRKRGWLDGRERTSIVPAVEEIPVLDKVLRLPSIGTRAVGRQAARLAPGQRSRYHRDERR